MVLTKSNFATSATTINAIVITVGIIEAIFRAALAGLRGYSSSYSQYTVMITNHCMKPRAIVISSNTQVPSSTSKV